MIYDMHVLVGVRRMAFVVAMSACSGAPPDADALAAQRLQVATGVALAIDVKVAEERALTLLALRRHSEAAAEANAVLAVAAGSARAHAVLGLATWHAAHAETKSPAAQLLAEAEGATLAGVRIAPGDLVVALLHGQLLAASGHLSAAAAAGEACLAVDGAGESPERLMLLVAVGEWCHELGEERRAIRHLSRVAPHRPKDATLHFRLGACLLRTADTAQQVESAVLALAHAAELAPGDDDAALAVVAAHLRVVELLRRDGAGPEAEAALVRCAAAADRVAERFPRLAEAHFRCGVVAELRGNSAAAQSAYERALECDARHLGSLLNLASALAGDAESRPRALQLWQRALAVDADSGGLADEERTRMCRSLEAPDK